MDEKIERIAEKVVRVANDFYHQETSIYTLLQESGYFESYDHIGGSEIIVALKNHPDLINDWLRYSEDQRSSPCWYFRKCDGENYSVGHYPETPEFGEIDFKNKFEACAAFVRKFIESVRSKYES